MASAPAVENETISPQQAVAVEPDELAGIDPPVSNEGAAPGGTPAATNDVAPKTEPIPSRSDEEQFPDDVIEDLSLIGFSPEIASRFRSVDDAREFVAEVARQRLSEMRAANGGNGQPAAQPPAPVPAQQAVPEKPQPAPQSRSADSPIQPFAFNEEWLKSAEEDAPQLVGQLRGLNEHYAKQQSDMFAAMNWMVDRLRDVSSADEQRTFMSQVDQLDTYVEKLGDEWKEVFGEGPTRAVDRNSEAWKARDMLFRAGQAFRRYGGKNGNGSMTGYLRLALGAEFGDKIKKLAENGISQQLRDQSGRFTARPTAPTRSGKPSSSARNESGELDELAGLPE